MTKLNKVEDNVFRVSINVYGSLSYMRNIVNRLTFEGFEQARCREQCN